MRMQDTDTYSPDEMTVSEVAAAFRVTIPTVRTWDRDGKLESFRTPGNHRRFRRSQNPSIPTPVETSPEAASTGVSFIP